VIVVNGEPFDLKPGASVLELVELLGAPRSGVAVAVDSAVIPRSEWERVVVGDGASVEVLTAVQGG
jgi:sulfur carrier protein